MLEAQTKTLSTHFSLLSTYEQSQALLIALQWRSCQSGIL